MIVKTVVKSKRFLNAQCIGICAMAFLGGHGARAQSVWDAKCARGMTHWHYVRSLPEQPATQVAREDALETLLCIARRDQSAPSPATDAVRALFGLSQDEAEARKVLLELALDQSVSLAVHQTSCELLTLVADNNCARVVMKVLRDGPASGNWQGYFQLLRDVGDGEFLEWLDEQIGKAELESPYRKFLEDAGTKIRLQRTPEELLTRLRAENCLYDCSWYVLQAFRHGVDPAGVRATLVDVLSRPLKDATDAYRRGMLLHDCQEYGILSPEAAEGFRELAKLVRQGGDPDKRRTNDWVAQRILAKRAAFYRLAPTADRQQRDSGNP